MKINPVIVKELRGRMRGWRSLLILVIYLSVLSIISMMIYAAAKNAGAGFNSPQSSQVGKAIFFGLVTFQAIMVALLTPAFTSSAITQEREQKTYELLVTTLLPARSIIMGKLGSALAYVALLIIAIAPLESLAFMFGGVSPEEIILSQVVMLFAALLFASVGIFWSSIVKTSVASNVLTYGTILFLTLGVPFIYYIVTTMTMTSSYYGTSSVNTEGFFYFSLIMLSSHPVIALGMSEMYYLRGDSLFIYTTDNWGMFSSNGNTVLIISPWLLFCIEALLFSAILIFFSISRVQPVRYKSPLSS
ncbi:MAG TPA: ABC transporter permease subunit [Chloroflexia bacterium]|nr:ABC transporter permease subunit [Chloroflexia bacterium]